MRPIVIAHRGASGYLPEHTLPAKQLAHEMGADFLEQDLVATRDDRLIVVHDIHLDRVTDVAERHPERARPDGRFYARDFDLEEVLDLRAWERLDARGRAVYPGRYPAKSGEFRLHTLEDELAFIRDLNAATGRKAGIYPEIKRPQWHREEGVDIAPMLLEILNDAGYRDRDDPVYLQCFDAAELRRVRFDLGCELKLVQLIGENSWRESPTDFDQLRTPEGFEQLASVVDGVGPALTQLYEAGGFRRRPAANGLVPMAHDHGLVVHPYTFRVDDLPAGFDDFDTLVRFFVSDVGVDGMFTDFPDRALRVIETQP